MLQYGIYRFVLASSRPACPLGPLIMQQFDGWRFDPEDRTLVLEFYLDFQYQLELLTLGISGLAKKIRKHLNLRPETCIRFMDRELRQHVVEDINGVTYASY